MKFYMKQRLFSIRQSFDIFDASENPIFHVEGKLLSFGRQQTLFDVKTGEALVEIKQKLLRLMPTMEINYQGKTVATIKQEITFFKPRYVVPELGWTVQGDFLAHDYDIFDQQGKVVASINKKFLAWSDTFEFDIQQDDVPFIIVVGVILGIDLTMDQYE